VPTLTDGSTTSPNISRGTEPSSFSLRLLQHVRWHAA
jgi:hypothetical protein